MTNSPANACVRVQLKERSYEIRVGRGIIKTLGRIYRPQSKRAVLISDVRLVEYRKQVLGVLAASGWQAHEIAVEAGETLKDINQIYPIYGRMLKAGLDRNSTLFALGGGTIGDAAGFVASTYLRGIRWVGLPTTLLAQVDSGIGGKTGINHADGKNLIGSFYQPSLVVCDTEFLSTLSARELISGLGEVIKYGLIYDRKFFAYIRDQWQAALDRDPRVIKHLVMTSAKWKAKVVGRDELDRTGLREVLNFGHTFGHALEGITRYQGFQHGEAVIWGMRFALRLAKIKRTISDKAWGDADRFLRQIPVPPLPEVAPDKYRSFMSKDKKSIEGKIRFVLLKSIGRAMLERNIRPSELLAALEFLYEEAES